MICILEFYDGFQNQEIKDVDRKNMGRYFQFLANKGTTLV